MRLDFYPVAPNLKQSLFSWPWLSLIWYSYHEDSEMSFAFTGEVVHVEKSETVLGLGSKPQFVDTNT